MRKEERRSAKAACSSRSLVDFALGFLEEAERFLVGARAGLDQGPELVERFAGIGEAAELLAGQGTNGQGDGQDLRGARTRLVGQAGERLERLVGPAGAVEGQATRVLIFGQAVGIAGGQLARGLEPLKRLGVQLGGARGADDRQPGRLVQALGVLGPTFGDLGCQARRGPVSVGSDFRAARTSDLSRSLLEERLDQLDGGPADGPGRARCWAAPRSRPGPCSRCCRRRAGGRRG